MSEFDMVKWMDEDLDPTKVRREESFTSDNHRAMVADHEFRKAKDKAEKTSLDFLLADLLSWWENTDTPKPKTRARVSVAVGELKPRVETRFTDRQLEIANAVITKREANGKG
jgi:hypothetical protein